MIKRRALLCALVAAALLVAVALALRPPFVFTTGDTPTGYSVDVWAEVAGRLGLAYEWVEYETVGEILDAVQSGAADVAIAGISMTRDREAVVDFTHPYFDAGLQIMVPAGASFSFREVVSHFLSPGMLSFLLIGLIAAAVAAEADRAGDAVDLPPLRIEDMRAQLAEIRAELEEAARRLHQVD